MIETPWYLLSPSVYTLTVWSMLALLQAQRLRPYSIKQWLYSFSLCVFTLGLVVIPFDSLWVIFQNIRFGHLYPEERWITLISSLVRNILFLLICIWQSKEAHKHLKWISLSYIIYFLPIFAIWFGLAPNPSWTDWTYAWRFEYGIFRVFQAFIISHVGMKFIQALIFYKLWSTEK